MVRIKLGFEQQMYLNEIILLRLCFGKCLRDAAGQNYIILLSLSDLKIRFRKRNAHQKQLFQSMDAGKRLKCEINLVDGRHIFFQTIQTNWWESRDLEYLWHLLWNTRWGSKKWLSSSHSAMIILIHIYLFTLNCIWTCHKDLVVNFWYYGSGPLKLFLGFRQKLLARHCNLLWLAYPPFDTTTTGISPYVSPSFAYRPHDSILDVPKPSLSSNLETYQAISLHHGSTYRTVETARGNAASFGLSHIITLSYNFCIVHQIYQEYPAHFWAPTCRACGNFTWSSRTRSYNTPRMGNRG